MLICPSADSKATLSKKRERKKESKTFTVCLFEVHFSSPPPLYFCQHSPSHFFPNNRSSPSSLPPFYPDSHRPSLLALTRFWCRRHAVCQNQIRTRGSREGIRQKKKKDSSSKTFFAKLKWVSEIPLSDERRQQRRKSESTRFGIKLFFLFWWPFSSSSSSSLSRWDSHSYANFQFWGEGEVTNHLLLFLFFFSETVSPGKQVEGKKDCDTPKKKNLRFFLFWAGV